MINYLKYSLILGFYVFQLAQSATSDRDLGALFKYFETLGYEAEEKCEKSANYEDLDALDNGKIPETETGKCLIACAFIEYGIIDENYKYNKDGIYDKLPKHLREHRELRNLRKLTARCEKAVAKVEDGDVCELASKIQLCFLQHEKEFGVKMFMGLIDLEYYDYT